MRLILPRGVARDLRLIFFSRSRFLERPAGVFGQHCAGGSACGDRQCFCHRQWRAWYNWRKTVCPLALQAVAGKERLRQEGRAPCSLAWAGLGSLCKLGALGVIGQEKAGPQPGPTHGDLSWQGNCPCLSDSASLLASCFLLSAQPSIQRPLQPYTSTRVGGDCVFCTSCSDQSITQSIQCFTIVYTCDYIECNLSQFTLRL